MVKVAKFSSDGKPIVSFPQDDMDYSLFAPDSPSLVVSEQLPIAIYWGGTSDIVIAQPGGGYGDEPGKIIIEPQNVPRLIGALNKLLAGADTANEAAPKWKDEAPVAQLDLETAISKIGEKKKEASKKEKEDLFTTAGAK